MDINKKANELQIVCNEIKKISETDKNLFEIIKINFKQNRITLSQNGKISLYFFNTVEELNRIYPNYTFIPVVKNNKYYLANYKYLRIIYQSKNDYLSYLSWDFGENDFEDFCTYYLSKNLKVKEEEINLDNFNLVELMESVEYFNNMV